MLKKKTENKHFLAFFNVLCFEAMKMKLLEANIFIRSWLVVHQRENCFQFIYSFWHIQNINGWSDQLQLRLHYRSENYLLFQTVLFLELKEISCSIKRRIQNAIVSIMYVLREAQAATKNEKFISNLYVMIVMMIQLVFYPFGKSIHLMSLFNCACMLQILNS